MSNATIETRARRIIERLKMFNRKEPDHLMQMDENPESTGESVTRMLEKG